ncbi:pentatricopeptide repeat-containing protein At3g29230 [Rhodamnia argentea]|uniref:Pentatricopeptide repeat-containing protein At3g29230 n=1 Tax=Rhodamnia argentea TaxID=178133 RepID=A0A8B8MUI9_9MYRT|nr:pentatricopeptide repeat-containing protein At3g29230 [Rhodamnia argentea]
MLTSSAEAGMSVPVRTPRWVSPRRMFEQKLSDLHRCTNLSHIKQVHAQILKASLHGDAHVAAKLVAAFSLCRHMALAVSVFDQIPEPTAHLYNILIRAYAQNSEASRAFATFLQMQRNGVFADNFTYPCLLRACCGQTSLSLVQMIHAHIEKFGFWADIFVPNSLIDTYCKCGSLGVRAARKLFDSMAVRDTVSWNTIITGLVKAGQLLEARQLFDEMPERDTISWNILLDGYAKAGEMNAAFELFGEMPRRNVVSWSTMISGYSEAGEMDMARVLFDKMPAKNLVPWTIIISGYAKKGMAKEASQLYDQMEKSGLVPDEGTVISILAASAESGLLRLGMKVHAWVERTKFKCSTLVTNALIDMYAKCGRLDDALSIFNLMTKKDIVSWNIMIQGLAMHGNGEKALHLFSRMEEEGFEPDGVTFIGVLCACTHAGLVDEGLDYFNYMERDFRIVPQVEHYGCVIDLLGRRGRLKEAFALVQRMPIEPNAIIWGTLLGACRIHNNTDVASEVVSHLIKLDTSDSGNFSLMSNIHATTGDWDGVANIRREMKNTRLQKPSGESSVELGNEVHKFTVFDTSHPESDGIYQMITTLGLELE